MSTGQEAPESPAPKHEAAATDELMLAFASDLKKLFPIERLRAGCRVTPGGIFIEESAVEELVTAFQEWLRDKTGGEVVKSRAKTVRRLFGSEEPSQFYLIEGKLCLRGHLVAFKIPEPQKYNVPYYLGSLSPAGEYLHPRDPLFASMPGVEAIPAGGGTDIRIALAKRTLYFPHDAIRKFAALLSGSRHGRADQRPLPLIDSVKALLNLARRARPARPNRGLLVPMRFSNPKKHVYLLAGGIVFVTDKPGRVASCYELRGRNLHVFLRDEFASLRETYRSRRHGSFEIADRHNEFLGRFEIRRTAYRLRPRAFLEFVQRIYDVTRNKGAFSKAYTVKECFEELSSVFQTSQPIDRKLLPSLRDDKRYSGKTFRVSGGWVFVLAKDDTIDGCVARYRTLERKPKNT